MKKEGGGRTRFSGIVLKTPQEIESIREAGRILYGCLQIVRQAAVERVRTRELDAIAEEYIRARGGKPAFKGYRGFPATLCISVNDRVVHGIPDHTRFAEGDVVSVDGGCYVMDGGSQWHGDSAFTVIVGEGSEEDRALVDATEESLWRALAALSGSPFHEVLKEPLRRMQASGGTGTRPSVSANTVTPSSLGVLWKVASIARPSHSGPWRSSSCSVP